MVTVAFQVVDVVRTELRSRSPMWKVEAGGLVGEATGADVEVKVGRGVADAGSIVFVDSGVGVAGAEVAVKVGRVVAVGGMDVKVGKGVGDAGSVVFVGRGVGVSGIAEAVNVGRNVAVATGAPASH
jgi:hypothetical protein